MKLYELIRRPPFFMRASHYIKKDDKPIRSNEKSRKSVLVPLVAMQFGNMKSKGSSLGGNSKTILSIIKEMIKSAKGLLNNPKTGKKNIDAETLNALENYALELGISKFGYTKVKPNFIFDRFEILYDNAMMLLMEMDRPIIKSKDPQASGQEIMRAYNELGIIVNKLAVFLRERGYNCHPSPALGGDICTVPVAQDAGLGAVGKNGLLVTPEFGPSHRIGALFIDADNLPLKTLAENEHLWIKDFCETCNHCVKSCPGKAIYKETRILNDGFPQFIEREKCAPPFSNNCCICISSCPFFTGNYDQIKKSFEKRKSKGDH